MGLINVEIKAFCHDPEHIRKVLYEKGAEKKGTDQQVDTYFKVNNGRLKIREGNIENYLIFYNRENQAGPKTSNVTLIPKPSKTLLEVLTRSVGLKVIVNKKREIYYIDNVKFHIDQVEGLGDFVEIEAAGEDTADKDVLKKQVDQYMELFEIKEDDLIDKSYSDMLLEHDD